MKINERPFRGNDDLFGIGQLVRGAYAKAPDWNAWSFARFDIWAQRRIGDEQVYDRRDWHKDIRLWETEQGKLIGSALFESDHDAALITDPDHPEITEALLNWAEARHSEKGIADGPLSIEAMASNTFHEQLLRSRDYVKITGHYIHRQKRLDDAQVEPVLLPEGFVVTPMETPGEMKRFHAAVKTVFGFEDSVEVYRIVQRAPSYVPELDLILLSKGGKVAAFCTAWFDKENSVAELEPVGTVPDFRKRGLGTALLAEASNCLRALGCNKVTVNSWSESIGANQLYEAAGFQAKVKIGGWERKVIVPD